MLLYRVIKQLLRLRNLLTYFRQISQLERCPVFVNQLSDIEPVEKKRIIFYIKTFLREVERLMDKVGVGIVHCGVARKGPTSDDYKNGAHQK